MINEIKDQESNVSLDYVNDIISIKSDEDDASIIISIPKQIENIFEENRLHDLKRFMKKRQCLNEANIIMVYLFHIIQAGGIITTTIAGGYSIKELIWVGISLNLIASLINIFEQINNNISVKLFKNIKDIKDNIYIDESILVEDNKQVTSDRAYSNQIGIPTPSKQNTSPLSRIQTANNSSFYNNIIKSKINDGIDKLVAGTKYVNSPLSKVQSKNISKTQTQTQTQQSQSQMQQSQQSQSQPQSQQSQSQKQQEQELEQNEVQISTPKNQGIVPPSANVLQPRNGKAPK